MFETALTDKSLAICVYISRSGSYDLVDNFLEAFSSQFVAQVNFKCHFGPNFTTSQKKDIKASNT
jgi:hypothetical protein